MLWNALNDLICEHFQNNCKAECSSCLSSILHGTPLCTSVSLFPQVSWRNYHEDDWLSGPHLLISLCPSDGMLCWFKAREHTLQGFSLSWESQLQLIKCTQVVSQDLSLLFSVTSDNTEMLPYIQAVAVATLTTLITQASTLWVTENLE